MLKTRNLAILIWLLGLTIFLFGARGVLEQLTLASVMPLALVLLAVAGAMLAVLRFRRGVQLLSESLAAAKGDPSRLKLAWAGSEWRELSGAIEQFAQTAAGSIAEAQLGVRQAQIQLQVVQAESQHAQSAIGQVADAVTAAAPPPPDELALKELAEMKNEFVSSVSHELRTPLASIKAYAEMLIDGEAGDDKTRRDFYEVIQNEANRLGRLIDNILNVSRIEAGLVRINKKPQSLAPLICEAIEVITPQARAKNITIDQKIVCEDTQVLVDKDMLYQAILNLLSNAVKYTPCGGAICVTVAVDPAAGTIKVDISDSGVGIPASDLPHVFKKFYRVEANTRIAQGTGLGLSLVKHVIETVHRGRVSVRSEVDKGSCFEFELELCSADDQATGDALDRKGAPVAAEGSQR